MAIEAKHVRIYISRILMILMENACSIIQRHPYVSGTLSLFFLMYWFLPFVFSLLVYSIPVVVCATVLVRVFFCSENLYIHDFKDVGKKEHKFPSVKPTSREKVVIKKHMRPRIEPQMSKRRNLKMYDIKEMTQVNDTSILDDVLLSRFANNKENATNNARLQNEDADECFLDADVKPSNDEITPQDALDDNCNGGNTNSLEIDTLEQEAEDEDDEDAEDKNRAVEWTEDDQKNVMDLGFSEIERNRRLENLIAKRRARKLLRMKVQENLIDDDVKHPGYVPPVHIAKTNPFDTPKAEELLGTEAPGSAPSIMLPSHNPFDLPYDPHEEKPNLSSVHDSNQELLGIFPRDIFCRHESFSRGPSFLAETNDHRGSMNMFGTGYSRFRPQSEKGDHDKLVERILYHEGPSEGHDHEDIAYINKEQENIDKVPELMSSSKENDVQGNNESDNLITSKGNEVEHTEALNLESPINEASSSTGPVEEDKKNEQTASSSPQDCNIAVHTAESEDTASSDDEMNEQHDISGISVQEPFPDSNPNRMVTSEPVYDSVPSPSAVDSLLKGIAHSATHSIASDMHVEVSEAGSSHNAMDGLTSPSSDVESTNYDVDAMEGKSNPFYDDIWKVSSYQSMTEGEESRSGEVSDYTIPDNIEAARSFEKYDSFNNPTESLLSLPEIIGQDSVDGLSTTSSMIEVHQPESADDVSDSNELKGSRNDSPVSSNDPRFDESINLMKRTRGNNDGESSPTKSEDLNENGKVLILSGVVKQEITESVVTSTEQSFGMNGQTTDTIQEQENQHSIKENLESSIKHEFKMELEERGEKASHGSPSETELVQGQETQHIAEDKKDRPEISIRDEKGMELKKVREESTPGFLKDGENESREQIDHGVINCPKESEEEVHKNSNIPQHAEALIRDEEEMEHKEVGKKGSPGSSKEEENESKEQMGHEAINCSKVPEEVHINSEIPQHLDSN